MELTHHRDVGHLETSSGHAKVYTHPPMPIRMNQVVVVIVVVVGQTLNYCLLVSWNSWRPDLATYPHGSRTIHDHRNLSQTVNNEPHYRCVTYLAFWRMVESTKCKHNKQLSFNEPNRTGNRRGRWGKK